MTDLTPETRAQWRKDAERDASHINGAPHNEAARILALLDAHDDAEDRVTIHEGIARTKTSAILALEARAEQAEAERETWRDRSCRYAEEADHHERRANLAEAEVQRLRRVNTENIVERKQAEAALSRVLADMEALADERQREVDEANRRVEVEVGRESRMRAFVFVDDLRALLATHRKAPTAAEDRAGGPHGVDVAPSATEDANGAQGGDDA